MTTPDLMSWKCKLGLILILTAPYKEESTMTVNIYVKAVSLASLACQN